MFIPMMSWNTKVRRVLVGLVQPAPEVGRVNLMFLIPRVNDRLVGAIMVQGLFYDIRLGVDIVFLLYVVRSHVLGRDQSG